MPRASESTRLAITNAATELFAERGFDGTSVRDIVARAQVNQAAINYHFTNKEGLYGEILKNAFAAFTANTAGEGVQWQTMGPEEALRQFVHQQLRPLLFRDEVSRFVRIFAWESVRPTKVLGRLLQTEAGRYVGLATSLVRRFMPPQTADADVLCTVLWLIGGCSIFVRNREYLAQPPFAMRIDAKFVDHLTELITQLALAGLAHQQHGASSG